MTVLSAPASNVLGDAEFATVARIAHGEAGLVLEPSKAPMIASRLAKRLRALDLDTYEAYCRLITSPEGSPEIRELISALTTNVTHFFREPHHFETLRDRVVPDLKRAATRGERVRLWSAGCSTGQEPCSIAMALLEAWPEAASHALILATDIDPAIVKAARVGQFGESVMENVSEAQRGRYFREENDGSGKVWTMGPALRSMIRINELNLLHRWPMQGLFDAIFCRNVVIYFDDKTQAALWPRFEAALKPDGWLFLGHSERVADGTTRDLTSVGITTYQRKQVDQAGL